MDDFGEFFATGGDKMAEYLFSQYNEKLEAEFIMRARSIFDEFVCPSTGTILICTFSDLLQGINRFWSLAEEMKGFTHEIHERIINLPLLYALVLLRLIEKEYTQEDNEKNPADPQLGETLLKLFVDIHSKLGNYKKSRDHKVLLSTCLMYLRYLLAIIGADQRIKKIKWSELNANNVKIACPIRDNDMKSFLECLRHFREVILPKYSKRPVPFKLIFFNRYPEVMEPTREYQGEIASFIFVVSVWMIILSILSFGFTGIIAYMGRPRATTSIPATSNQSRTRIPTIPAVTNSKLSDAENEDDSEKPSIPTKPSMPTKPSNYFDEKIQKLNSKAKIDSPTPQTNPLSPPPHRKRAKKEKEKT